MDIYYLIKSYKLKAHIFLTLIIFYNAFFSNLSGLVERVTFHNADNGFCVLKVQVKGKKDLFTVIGHVSTISAGEFIQASGIWFHDKQHGLSSISNSNSAYNFRRH